MSATQRDAIRFFCQQKSMTEEQLADEINKAFEQPSDEELINVLNKGAAIGRKEMLDKATRWLLDEMFVEDVDGEPYVMSGTASSIEEFIGNFKKSMEEQQ